MKEKELLYKELSYKIVGCCYDVYNELGPAHKEQVYQEALKLSFGDKHIRYETQKRIKIKFKGKGSRYLRARFCDRG